MTEDINFIRIHRPKRREKVTVDELIYIYTHILNVLGKN